MRVKEAYGPIGDSQRRVAQPVVASCADAEAHIWHRGVQAKSRLRFANSPADRIITCYWIVNAIPPQCLKGKRKW